jgi:hypothetical protein
MKENEMDGACSTHGRGEELVRNFGRRTWIRLSQDRFQRATLEKTIINCRVP